MRKIGQLQGQRTRRPYNTHTPCEVIRIGADKATIQMYHETSRCNSGGPRPVLRAGRPLSVELASRPHILHRTEVSKGLMGNIVGGIQRPLRVFSLTSQNV